MYLIAMTTGIILLPSFIIHLLKERGLRWPEIKVSRWIVVAATLQFLISVFYSFYTNQYVNFIMHTVGGGVACSLMFRHISDQMAWKLKAIEQWLLLFAFVSAFGVLNELAEASLDYLNFGLFSINRTDTWLDLLANSLGGLVGNLIVTNIKQVKSLFSN